MTTPRQALETINAIRNLEAAESMLKKVPQILEPRDLPSSKKLLLAHAVQNLVIAHSCSPRDPQHATIQPDFKTSQLL